MGSNPTEGKICFSHFTPFYEVECEELFCKTNLKQKCIEINKNKNLIKILDDIKMKRFDLHWLIESIPEGFWSLFLLPDGIWLGAFVEINTFKEF